MHNASPKRVSVAAMRVLNAIQDEQPDVQLAAAAALFLILCSRTDIHPGTALACAGNIIRSARRYDKGTFKGVSDYIDNEL